MSQPKIQSKTQTHKGQTQILEELIPSILHFNKLGTSSYIPLGPCWTKLSCHLKLADHRWSTVPGYGAIAVTHTHTHTHMHAHTRNQPVLPICTQEVKSKTPVNKKINVFIELFCQLNHHLWQNSNIRIKIKPECANMSKLYKCQKIR